MGGGCERTEVIHLHTPSRGEKRSRTEEENREGEEEEDDDEEEV